MDAERARGLVKEALDAGGEEAAGLCREALGLDPGCFGARALLCTTLAGLGRAEEALGHMDGPALDGPDQAMARLIRADLLGSLGRHGEALECIEGADAGGAGGRTAAMVYHKRALLLHRAGRSAEAAGFMGRAIEMDPGDADAHFNRGVMLTAAAGDGPGPEEAVRCYDEAIRLDPGRAGAMYNRGVLLSRLGRHEEAAGSLMAAVEADPGMAEAYDECGSALESCGRREEALGYYDGALALRPGFAEALYNKAHALFFLGRTGEAAACFAEAVRIKPGLPDAPPPPAAGGMIPGPPAEYRAKARALLAEAGRMLGDGDCEGAARACAEAGRHDSTDPEIPRLRGRALEGMGMREEAADSLANADNVEATALYVGGRAEEAVALCDAVVREGRATYRIRNIRGMALSALGRDAEAVGSYDEALAERPGDPSLLRNKARSLDALGDGAGAAACRAEAARADPGRA